MAEATPISLMSLVSTLPNELKQLMGGGAGHA